MTDKEIFPDLNHCSVGIIGLGYVGLPLALEIAKKRSRLISHSNDSKNIIGYDLNPDRIEELNNGCDKSGEIAQEDLQNNSFLKFTNRKSDF